MRKLASRVLVIASVLGVGVSLGGCYSQLRLDPHFGEAVNQAKAVQIADPDAHYAGTPAPGSNGRVVDSAQERYVRDQGIQPVSTQTATVAAGGSAPAGGAGATAPSSGQ